MSLSFLQIDWFSLCHVSRKLMDRFHLDNNRNGTVLLEWDLLRTVE